MKTMDISILLNIDFGNLNYSGLILKNNRFFICNTTFTSFEDLHAPFAKKLKHIF